MKPFGKTVKIGYAGATKIGKSHLAATFVKELDGIVFDWAPVMQYKPTATSAPQYFVSDSEEGEALTACINVGLNIDRQYKIVTSWDSLEGLIEYAKIYRDDISTKPNKRIWIVFDDCNMMRWHAAIHTCKASGNKSITRNNWGEATSLMTLMIRNLERDFNLIFVNQLADEYKSGESTGNKIGKFYPNGIEYALDVVGTYWVDDSVKPKVPHFRVEANRAAWLCSDTYIEDITNLDPKEMLRQMQIKEERW